MAQALLAARPAPAAIGQALGALPQRQELHAMALQHCRSAGTKRVRTRSARPDVTAGCPMEDAMATSPLEAQRTAAARIAGTVYRRCFTSCALRVATSAPQGFDRGLFWLRRRGGAVKEREVPRRECAWWWRLCGGTWWRTLPAMAPCPCPPGEPPRFSRMGGTGEVVRKTHLVGRDSPTLWGTATDWIANCICPDFRDGICCLPTQM